MTYQDNDDIIVKFINVLALVIISGCHMPVGGNFNVDFRRRSWSNTRLHLMISVMRSATCNVECTYHLDVNLFSQPDQFILSDVFYNDCMSEVSVFRDVDDNSSEPILRQLQIDVKLMAVCVQSRFHTARVIG